MTANHTRFYIYGTLRGGGLYVKETVSSEAQAAALVAQGYVAIDSQTMMPVQASREAKKKGKR